MGWGVINSWGSIYVNLRLVDGEYYNKPLIYEFTKQKTQYKNNQVKNRWKWDNLVTLVYKELRLMGIPGGKIFIKEDVGYRAGIHMKGYKNMNPVIIVGGKAGDFFGEYMAGGIIILLGLNAKDGEAIVGDYLGTGMHGGVIYVRDSVDLSLCGKEVGIEKIKQKDKKILEKHISEFCEDFNYNINDIFSKDFTRVYPKSSRPYGNLYAK